MKRKKIIWREHQSEGVRYIYPAGTFDTIQIRKNPATGRSGVFRVYIKNENGEWYEVGWYHYIREAKAAVIFMLHLEIK